VTSWNLPNSGGVKALDIFLRPFIKCIKVAAIHCYGRLAAKQGWMLFLWNFFPLLS